MLGNHVFLMIHFIKQSENKGTKEQTAKEIANFVSASGRLITNPVLIISYETLRAYVPVIKKCEIGLLLCDEGHRLKNAESQTYMAINELNAKRRVILSVFDMSTLK